MGWSRGRLWLVAGFLLPYAAFIVWFHAPYAAGSDASGYLHSARLLLEGRLTAPVRLPPGLPRDLVSNDAITPLGFRVDASGRNLVPTYPVGLPLHLAAVGWLTGLGPASTLIALLAALGFLSLLYGTSREFGVSPGWSAAVALVGALSPLTLDFALQPMSDLVAATWVLAAIYGALRASRHLAWAAGAGAAFACAVLVRPTNLLLILPLALALPTRPRAWLAFLAGGVPGALFLAGYNYQLYGHFIATGYGDVRSLFSLSYVPRSWWHYAKWIPVVATPLVLAVVLLPWCPLERRRKILLLLWAGVLLVFYSAYDPTHETWWYLRFILPGLPALGIGAALVLQHWQASAWNLELRPVSPSPAPGRVLRVPGAALLLAGVLGWVFAWSHALGVSKIETGTRAYPLTGQWVAEQLPANAVLLAYEVSGAVFYYSDRAWIVPNALTAEEARRLDAWLAAEKRELYAALYPSETAVLQERLPGKWEIVTRLRTTTIWRRISP
ncbi:MAG: hypothetical protein WDM96_09000 [Lacunisphaera sp.]